MVVKARGSFKRMMSIPLLSLMFCLGCNDDDNPDPNAPLVPGAGFTVYGVVDAEYGTVNIAVGHEGWPILDADVYMNGRRVPFVGEYTETGVSNPIYELEKLVLKPGDELTFTVQSDAGAGTYNVVIPERPNVISPEDHEFFSDFAPIPVIWNSCQFADQYCVILGGTTNPAHVDAPDTNYTFAPESTFPVSGAGIAVEAVNGDGDYYADRAIFPWGLNGFFAVSRTAFNITILE